MKKHIFLFAALLLISCSNDDESSNTFLEKYDGYFFVDDSDGIQFSNSETYMTWVIFNDPSDNSDDSCNECHFYKDIKDQELFCPDHGLNLLESNNLGFCKIIENSENKLIEECIECDGDNLDFKYTYEYTVDGDELSMLSISKNIDGSIDSSDISTYLKTSATFSCECE